MLHLIEIVWFSRSLFAYCMFCVLLSIQKVVNQNIFLRMYIRYLYKCVNSIVLINHIFWKMITSMSLVQVEVADFCIDVLVSLSGGEDG